MKLASLLLALMFVGPLAGCGEKPKYADPEEIKVADDNRIRAIENNPNLTPQQKEFQINRIRGQFNPKAR
jgi:hypothetical protein